MSEFGVYVHIPFCRERCDYCAFATYTDRDYLMERYADAVITDVARQAEAGALVPATSIFFGGGTPSRLDPALLCDILEAIPHTVDCEITVECNPEHADPAHLDTYAAAGVNRLSFGLQSTHHHVLEGLGRRHVPDAAATISAAVQAAGFRTWNLDLIFGSPAETDDDWVQTLDAVLSLPVPPPHLSAYALTVEPGTPLAAQAGRHPEEDAMARRYGITDDVLSAAGYVWEEISNWSRPGHECRHNHLYWEEGDYLGFGSAAHSHRAGERWWNVRTPDRYIHVIESGGSPVANREVLSQEQRDFERLTLALRTPRGVPWRALRGADELDDLIVRRGDHAVLTVRGRLLANEVSTRIALP